MAKRIDLSKTLVERVEEHKPEGFTNLDLARYSAQAQYASGFIRRVNERIFPAQVPREILDELDKAIPGRTGDDVYLMICQFHEAGRKQYPEDKEGHIKLGWLIRPFLAEKIYKEIDDKKRVLMRLVSKSRFQFKPTQETIKLMKKEEVKLGNWEYQEPPYGPSLELSS